LEEQSPGESPPPEQPPAFDIEAARARYRRMMRGRSMRALGVVTVVVLIFSWAFAIAAAYAPDVDHLPGHDITVTRDRCFACHARAIDGAPPMPHPATPTCGFCHVQGLPQSPPAGRLNDPFFRSVDVIR
jgi:hypothetical protein